MSSRKKSRRRHVPKRTCVGCRSVDPKRSMIRIVRGPDGVRIDETGKAPGRGTYLHDRRSCWQAGLNGSLEKALKVRLTQEERDRLVNYMEKMTDEQNG